MDRNTIVRSVVLCTLCWLCCYCLQVDSLPAADLDNTKLPTSVGVTNETQDNNKDSPTELSAALDTNKEVIFIRTGGVNYIRWGRNDCPDDVEMLYRGYTAGSHQSHAWGGSTTLCMHDDPEWGVTTLIGGNYIYGAEYAFAGSPFLLSNNGDNPLQHNDVPCASCYVPTRSSQLMIPGRWQCPPSWTLEYRGYVVSNMHDHARSDYLCMDEAPGVTVGGVGATNGERFMPVLAGCGSLPCPKYVTGRPITCVVCSK